MNTSLTLFTILVVLATGSPHHEKDHAEEMMDHSNMTHPMNETMEMPPPHLGNGTKPEHSGESKESNEKSESGRKRRGVAEDVKNAGSDALKKVEETGGSAIDTAEKYGKKGMKAVESAGDTVVTGAKDLWKKAENSV